ncbi:MAG: N-acetyl-gamma-glutamyl-phosphate reductase [Gammaproteobacteria bacterium]
MIKVGIIGATGYTGFELLRLLTMHPQADVIVATSRNEIGLQVTDLFPGLRGSTDLTFSDPQNEQIEECDVVFFATPNATAMHQVSAILEKGIKVIDLSADFRLKDSKVWSQWYGEAHASPELLEQAVYGLPEINRDAIATAQLVANPGCYPTAIVLALLPALEAGLVSAGELIADAKSGVSGAGRKAVLNSQFCETSETFKAYAVKGHRHLPEICQTLNNLSNKPVDLTFVPHLVPMVRGIHATVYAHISQKNTDFQRVYESRYKNAPFVDVLPSGSHPDTRSVRGTNICRIATHVPQQGEILVVLSVIDNLVKGAAGQAIQNMNIMFGLDEKEGMILPPLSP